MMKETMFREREQNGEGTYEKEEIVMEKEKILRMGGRVFFGREENREEKGGKYLEKISPKIVNDIEKSRFRSRSPDFCRFNLEGFDIGFGEFGLGKKSRFWFRET